MCATYGGIGIGELPSVGVAAVACADSNSLLAGLFFAGVVERSRSVVELAVLVEDAGEKQDGALRAGGDPFPVSGQGVVSQHLVEISVGPAVGGWFGQHV